MQTIDIIVVNYRIFSYYQQYNKPQACASLVQVTYISCLVYLCVFIILALDVFFLTVYGTNGEPQTDCAYKTVFR